MLNLKQKLEILCYLHNISLATLAQEVGVSKSTIIRWDVSNPSKATQLKLAQYFNVGVEQLLNKKTEVDEGLKSEEQKRKETIVDLLDLLKFSILSYDIAINLLICIKKNVDGKVMQNQSIKLDCDELIRFDEQHLSSDIEDDS